MRIIVLQTAGGPSASGDLGGGDRTFQLLAKQWTDMGIKVCLVTRSHYTATGWPVSSEDVVELGPKFSKDTFDNEWVIT